jgi:hypothetical protein
LRLKGKPDHQNSIKASASLRTAMTIFSGSLLHFFVRRLLAAGVAKLFCFQSLAVLLFVLRRRVIAVLAIATLQRNGFTHDSDPFPTRQPTNKEAKPTR